MSHPAPEGDIRLIEMDDGTEQWLDADDLCERCEDAPIAPSDYERGTLCETCQND